MLSDLVCIFIYFQWVDYLNGEYSKLEGVFGSTADTRISNKV